MKAHASSGITLVEIMIAVAILGAVIIPVVALLDYSNRGTREQDVEGIAANLAKERMNKLLFVVSRDNLISNSGTVTTESIKGNDISWEYQVYQFSNSEIGFTVPQFKFHDPQICSSGQEANPGGALDSPKTMTLAEVYPDDTTCRMADIKMTVKWKLPNQSTYDDRNQFDLIARRTFLVTE